MYYFIWNPAAGKGKAGQALPVIKSVMDKRGEKYTLLKTDYPGHATELAQTAVRDPEAKAVVAIGGDGTILETATGLIDMRLPLACIPLGNGNDFMRNFIDLGPFKTVEEKTKRCLDILLAGQSQVVDIITVNDRYALNIGNIGLDADVADLAFRIKHFFGSISYIIAMLKSLFTYKPLEAAVTVDDLRIQGLFTLIAVCNGTQYGGGFIIAPHARLDDGKITLCLVEQISRLKILILFPLVLIGKHTRLKEVRFIECERVEVEYEGSTKMCLDGNILNNKGPVSFTLIPAALEMIIDSNQINRKNSSRV